MQILLFWLFLCTFATPVNPVAAVIESEVGKEVVENLPTIGTHDGATNGIGKSIADGFRNVGRKVVTFGKSVGDGIKRVGSRIMNFRKKNPVPSAVQRDTPRAVPDIVAAVAPAAPKQPNLPVPQNPVPVPAPVLDPIPRAPILNAEIAGVVAKVTQEATRLQIKAFMLSAVKNPMGSAPLMKQVARGAMETALDNPILLLKVITTHTVPRMFQNVVGKIGALFNSMKSLAFRVLQIPETAIRVPTSEVVTPTTFRQQIADGVGRLGEEIQAMNLAIAVQANDLFIKFGATSPEALGSFHDLGATTMKKFLVDPKSLDDPVLDAFFVQLKAEHPEAIRLLSKSTGSGAIEVVGERLAVAKHEFIEAIEDLTIDRIRRRDTITSVRTDLLKVDVLIKQVLHQFDAVEATISTIEKSK